MSAKLDELVDAVVTARGCGCCGSSDELERLAPDACPVDEDFGKDHSYAGGCSHDFRSALERLVAAAKAEALEEAAPTVGQVLADAQRLARIVGAAP